MGTEIARIPRTVELGIQPALDFPQHQENAMSIRKLLITSCSLFALLAAVHLVGVHAQPANSAMAGPSDLPAVVHLTSADDHQRTMDLLKMTSIRNGRNGMNPKDPNYANYDESKADIRSEEHT